MDRASSMIIKNAQTLLKSGSASVFIHVAGAIGTVEVNAIDVADEPASMIGFNCPHNGRYYLVRGDAIIGFSSDGPDAVRFIAT